MIRKETMVLSVELAMNNPNVTLYPVPSTPIRELTELSTTPFPNRDPEKSVAQNLIDEVVETSNKEELGMSVTHNLRMNELSKTFMNTLFRRLEKLHDVIIPLVQDTASEMNYLVEQGLPTTPTIEQIEFDEAYSNNALMQLIAKYDDNIVYDATTLSGLSERNELEITGLLETGHVVLDGLIVNLVAKYPTSWLENIYATYFRAGEPTKVNTRFDPIQGFGLLDEMIIVFILCRAIQERQLVDATISMSSDQFYARLAQLMNAAGAVVKRNLNRFKDIKDSGRVIGYEDKNTNTIYVIGSNYNKYLVGGGTPEGIFGALARNAISLHDSVEKLLENHNQYVGYWEADYNKRMNAIDAQFWELLKTVFPKAFSNNLVKMSDDTISLFGFISEYAGVPQGTILTRELIPTYAAHLVQLLPRYTNLGKDIPALCRTLIIDNGLAHLEYGKFLDVMENEMARHSTAGQPLSPREACFYAVLDELVEMFIKTNTLNGIPQGIPTEEL